MGSIPHETTLDDGPTRSIREVHGTPFLFVHIEGDRPACGSARYCLKGVSTVLLGRGERRCAELDRTRSSLVVRLPAAAMSSLHARLEQTQGEWRIADQKSRNGTFVNGARVDETSLGDSDLIETGRCILSVRWLVHPPDADLGDCESDDLWRTCTGLATLDPHFGAQLAQLVRVATTNIPVLVLGETGTGKELMARAIHESSGRSGPFVAVNCSAIPRGLVEATLFGHMRGAFSGALRDEPGFVRSAHQGTLLLDEIGDLPPAAQGALLRVLQEREVVPVGSTRAVPVDTRTVAATLRPLRELVASGTFRPDLLARLQGFALTIPPLRERKLDLGHLVATIVRRAVPERAASIRMSPSVLRALFAYAWPHNIRELEQALVTALALAPDGVVRSEHLGAALPATTTLASSSVTQEPTEPELRAKLEAALSEHDGNVRAVARVVGKAPTQVYRWLRRFGLDPERFRRKP